MATSQQNDDTFINDDKVVLLAGLLTKYKIKLWELKDLETNPDCLSDELLMQLSDESGLDEVEVKQILVKLQKHSIKKLESNSRFLKNGIATFTVKVIGNNNQIREKTFKDQIEVSVSLNGRGLKAFIMDKFQLTCETIKLISNGKVLKDDVNLNAQDMKNNSVIIAMCVYENLLYDKTNEDFKLIADIKDAIGVLTASSTNQDERRQLQLQDQNGVKLDLTRADETYLTSAMVLHEKGKLFIKRKEYLKAIIVLAEADNQFKNCINRSLLEKVDNYALLNLDIVWCYLCMQNLNDLNNAEERLNTCEKSLEKCYGANLERLSRIQHEDVNKYRPIFIRLNLLKGILFYHKGKKLESKHFLDLANNELKKNFVDEEKVVQVMSMGFSNVQARLALRVSNGNVDRAIDYIIKKKEREKQAKIQQQEEAHAKYLQETYGLTLNTSKPLHPQVLKDIMQFGYTEKKAATALIQSDNDFNFALDILQSQVTTYDDDMDFDKNNQAKSSSKADLSVDHQNDTLFNMGFDVELSTLCLNYFDGNIQKSINYLLSKANDMKTEDGLKRLKAELDGKSASSKTGICRTEEEKIKQQNAQDFIDVLMKDVADEDDEAYLDFNLDDDSLFLNKYFSLLGF